MKEKMVTFAGKEFTLDQIKGTVKLLRYYRAFIRSDKEQAKDPEGMWGYGVMDKDQARRRLKFLINVAINRKAGIPDVVGRKQTPEYQRDLAYDCRDVNEWRRHSSLWCRRPRHRLRTKEIHEHFERIWEAEGFADPGRCFDREDY